MILWLPPRLSQSLEHLEEHQGLLRKRHLQVGFRSRGTPGTPGTPRAGWFVSWFKSPEKNGGFWWKKWGTPIWWLTPPRCLGWDVPSSQHSYGTWPKSMNCLVIFHRSARETNQKWVCIYIIIYIYIHPIYIHIPSGKLSHNYGTSPFLMGKLTINCHFQWLFT